MRNGLPAKKRSDAILFEGKKYGVGRLLDALKKSGGEGNDGPSDEDISQGAPTNSRKTKNCLPRLVNVMVLPEFRPRMVASEAQASRAELDVGAVGARRSVWVDLASAFRDPNTPVRGTHRVGGDGIVRGSGRAFLHDLAGCHSWQTVMLVLIKLSANNTWHTCWQPHSPHAASNTHPV